MKFLDTETDTQAKGMICDWVAKNILVKPRQMLQNVRFNQGIIRPQAVVEADVVDEREASSQHRITDFFRRV